MASYRYLPRYIHVIVYEQWHFTLLDARIKATLAYVLKLRNHQTCVIISFSKTYIRTFPPCLNFNYHDHVMSSSSNCIRGQEHERATLHRGCTLESSDQVFACLPEKGEKVSCLLVSCFSLVNIFTAIAVAVSS